MHFPTSTAASTTALLTLLTLTPLATAANCYTGSTKSCESRDSLYKFRQNYCGDTDHWKSSGGYTWGWASLELRGKFNAQQTCWDAFQSIIDQCDGKKAGGTYDYDFDGVSSHLDVHFCLS